MKRKNSGVTLIALIITIIVLLILAGVTIAMIVGDNGILNRATDASRETEIASVKEQAQLDITNWVAEEVENGRNGTISSWEDIKNILDTANPNAQDRYYTNVTEEGIETPNGYLVPIEELYTNGSSGGETTSKTIDDLVAGEKVYYDTGDTSVGNEGIIECIVLYDSSSEYGVQIISADTIADVTLGDNDFNIAVNSYNNAITTLNTKAEDYLNKTYASDARCVGSVPNNKNEESGNFTSVYSYMSGYTVKDADINYETDYNQMEILNITIADDSYWLASRNLGSQSYTSALAVRFISNLEGLSDSWMCRFYNSGERISESFSYGIRPVFILNPGLKVTEGDGETTPYTLAP